MSKARSITISVGNRFEDLDARQGNRVVRITDVAGPLVRYVVEVAEWNPSTVGRRRWVLARTILKRYWRISR
jgi:hypothetical protein